MDIANKYCLYIGSVRGTIQTTCCLPNEKLIYTKSDPSSEITALEWGRIDTELAVGHLNGHVRLYNTNNLTQTPKTIADLEGGGCVSGVGRLDDTRLVIARHDGIITIWSEASSCDDYFSINLDEQGTLDCMACCSGRPNVVGTGGEFNDFKLWDVETKRCLFKAKSMGHDELNLPIPTSIRGIAFLSENDGHLSLCATKEGHVLLYDDRAQRRPVLKYVEKKKGAQISYTCITTAYRQRQCLVGTTKGYMQLLDMKVPGKCLNTFTTYTGSVTSIACDPFEPYVASTSLDRHLRIHNLDTKELVYKAYLKQNLTKILMKPVIKEEIDDEIKDEKDIIADDEEYEEIFSNMEVIEEKKRKLDGGDKKVDKKKKKKRIAQINNDKCI